MSSEKWSSEANNDPFTGGQYDQAYTIPFTTDSKFNTDFTPPPPSFTTGFTGKVQEKPPKVQEKPRYRTPVIINGERRELDMHPLWLFGFILIFVLIICGTILTAFVVISRVAKKQEVREPEEWKTRNRNSSNRLSFSTYPQRTIVQPTPISTPTLPIYSGPIVYAPQSPVVNMVNEYSGEELPPPPYSPRHIPKT